MNYDYVFFCPETIQPSITPMPFMEHSNRRIREINQHRFSFFNSAQIVFRGRNLRRLGISCQKKMLSFLDNLTSRTL